MVDWSFRPAIPADVHVARELLAAEGLPTEDLSVECLAIVAEVSGNIAGMIGLETYDGAGLLRSLVVAKKFRGSGLGNALVAALEKLAGQDGLGEMWLLTIDADRWFATLGYVAQERADAPQEIRETEEFSSLCPGDAVLMKKTLGP